MRVIITGGTGLIGRELANSLAHDHHEVIVLTRNTNKSSGLDGSVKLVKWDGRTVQGWGELANGAGAIVNLAGESIAGEGFPPSRWTKERKKRIVESRINAGKAVVEAITAAAQKPDVLIQASAVGYYGTHGDEPITEEHAPGSDFLAHTCVQWEAVTEPVEKLGVRRAIIRTGILLTNKGGVLPQLSLPFKLFAGGPIGSGKQQMPWIHIDDEVGAIRFLIDTPSAKGAYNLSAPHVVNNAALAKILGRVLKRPSFVPAPAFAFKLAFGELSILLLEGQRAIPKRLEEAGYAFKFPEPEPALKDLLDNNK
ncbi:MAG: TIGR01777 family oxidoreductase [Chloroflexi bacterium]|nr:TIGR01777 family oxidoreductase [Chloroflexota bacterium]MCC6895213.1 TIGR01777 family oxidoreductase [Anaerolineae bacterium]